MRKIGQIGHEHVEQNDQTYRTNNSIRTTGVHRISKSKRPDRTRSTKITTCTSNANRTN